MAANINYEMMIVLNDKFNSNELKTWAFNYAKYLRKLSAKEISVISRGKRTLAYLINNQKKGNYIQINFSSIPNFIKNFSESLKFDDNILRFLIIKR